MNHRNGEIGFYKLVEHNQEKRTLYMHCKNPYPCDFDRGIIISMARKFGTTTIKVERDANKPSRKDGADDSYYIVSY